MSAIAEQIFYGSITVRAGVAREFSAFMCKGMGYQFNDDRITRIADTAERLIDEGWAPRFAFGQALDLELLWFGDPHARGRYIPISDVAIEDAGPRTDFVAEKLSEMLDRG